MNEDGLMNQWNEIKRTNISIIEVSEKERGWARNIFGEIMVVNFSNLRKKQTFRSRKSREVQTRWTQRNPWQDIRWLKCQKLKIENTKAASEKQVYIKGNPHKTISRNLSRNFANQNGMTRYIQSTEGKVKNKTKQFST